MKKAGRVFGARSLFLGAQDYWYRDGSRAKHTICFSRTNRHFPRFNADSTIRHIVESSIKHGKISITTLCFCLIGRRCGSFISPRAAFISLSCWFLQEKLSSDFISDGKLTNVDFLSELVWRACSLVLVLILSGVGCRCVGEHIHWSQAWLEHHQLERGYNLPCSISFTCFTI